jgi:DNA modification methylase
MLESQREGSDFGDQYFPVFDYEAPDPLIFTPKPSRRERDIGLGEEFPLQEVPHGGHGNAEEDPITRKMRDGPVRNVHPTVKSTALFRYLCRLLTPTGGTVLDPFAGSGTTGCAAEMEGFASLLIDLKESHAKIARARVTHTEKRVALKVPLLGKPRSKSATGSLFGDEE